MSIAVPFDFLKQRPQAGDVVPFDVTATGEFVDEESRDFVVAGEPVEEPDQIRRSWSDLVPIWSTRSGPRRSILVWAGLVVPEVTVGPDLIGPDWVEEIDDF